MKQLINRPLIRTLFARLVSSLGVALLAFYLADSLSASEFGRFQFFMTVVVAASVVLRTGADRALIRFVGRIYHQDIAEALAYLFTATFYSVCLGFVLSLVGFLAFYFNPDIVPDRYQIFVPYVLITPWLVAVTFLFSGYFKGSSRPARALLQENGATSLIAVFLIWVAYEVFHTVSLGTSLALYLVALISVVALGVVDIFVDIRKSESKIWVKSRRAVKDLIASSPSFFQMTALVQVQHVLVATLLVATAGDEVLGIFKLAEKISLLSALAFTVVNSLYQPKFARLFHLSDFDGLSKAARQAFTLSAVLGGPVSLVILLFPQIILGAFGSEYVAGVQVLQLLAIAQLINILFGPVGSILNMTGHERVTRNIFLAVAILSVPLFYLLIVSYGAIGAAVATVVTLTIQNGMCLFMVFRKLRISLFGKLFSLRLIS